MSLALLVVLAPPWLTAWEDDGRSPLRLYSGISLIEVSGGSGTVLLIAYLVLMLTFLLLPATIVGVVCSLAGLVVTIVSMMVEPNPAPTWNDQTYQVAWTGAPIVAAVVWLVAVLVASAGWSAPRRA